MSVQQLANTIAQAVKARQNQSGGQSVKVGIVSGRFVDVAGRRMPYSAAVDVPFKDGEAVYVVINDSGSKAVIVGK